MKYKIVYNFFLDEVLQLYLPESVLCCYSDDKLGLYYKKATSTTMDGLSSVSYLETPHEQAMTICAELSEPNLSRKFKPKGKRKFDFKSISEDREIKKHCENLVSKRIDILMRLCQENNYPITIGLGRKDEGKDFSYQIQPWTSEPILMFEKGAEGVTYSLALEREGVVFYPSELSVKVLSNKPGWIAMGKKLYKLNQLNGNKLKPFLNRSSINIPSRSVRTYFEKVVMDLVPLFKVVSKGFDIIKKNKLVRTKLRLAENLFTRDLELRLWFVYETHNFVHGNLQTSKTMIDFGDGDDIVITMQQRNDSAESELVEQLTTLGLQVTDSGSFSTGRGGDTVVSWLRTHRAALQTDCGIDMTDIQYGDKRIDLNVPDIQVNCLAENDWFDVQGIVRLGKIDIPFKDLMQNIRDENPYYKLEDGSFFIIPQEWMTKYASLAKFGQENNGRFRLSKNYLGIVEELDGGAAQNPTGPNSVEIEDVETTYRPSDRLNATLRPYQLNGVKWLRKLRHNGLGACLADDMGLGKTLQVIAALLAAKEELDEEQVEETDSGQMSMFGSIESRSASLNALVVVPASLVFNWKEEIAKFAPDLITTAYVGAQRKSSGVILESFDVILTTYQTALRDKEILSKISWRYIVLDESQYIKNINSKVFKALSELTAESKISLSGTPIENSLSDLWSQMEFINPEILGSFEFFKTNFKVPIEKDRDEASIAELKKIVDPFLLRRTKYEVAPDLPAKFEQSLYVEMTDEQKSLFEERKSAARNLILNLDESDREYHIHVFKEILMLRQISNHPALYDENYNHGSGKMELVLNKLKELVLSDKKILVFSSFTSLLDLVAAELESENIPYLTLTGSHTQKQREKSVKQFQNNDEKKVFLISIKAGGAGLNLTAAEYVFILDPWWNPFIEEQAIARAHRIGQTQQVHVIKFISKNSIEEKIQKLQNNKRLLNEDILSGPVSSIRSKKELLDILD